MGTFMKTGLLLHPQALTTATKSNLLQTRLSNRGQVSKGVCSQHIRISYSSYSIYPSLSLSRSGAISKVPHGEEARNGLTNE